MNLNKEGRTMLDIAMLATLLVSFGLIKLFLDWCNGQVDKVDRKEKK